MEARITFRGEIFINGDNEQEIINKYEGMGLFSVEALDNFADVVETISIIDTETGKKIEY